MAAAESKLVDVDKQLNTSNSTEIKIKNGIVTEPFHMPPPNLQLSSLRTLSTVALAAVRLKCRVGVRVSVPDEFDASAPRIEGTIVELCKDGDVAVRYANGDEDEVNINDLIILPSNSKKKKKKPLERLRTIAKVALATVRLKFGARADNDVAVSSNDSVKASVFEETNEIETIYSKDKPKGIKSSTSNYAIGVLTSSPSNNSKGESSGFFATVDSLQAEKDMKTEKTVPQNEIKESKSSAVANPNNTVNGVSVAKEGEKESKHSALANTNSTVIDVSIAKEENYAGKKSNDSIVRDIDNKRVEKIKVGTKVSVYNEYDLNAERIIGTVVQICDDGDVAVRYSNGDEDEVSIGDLIILDEQVDFKVSNTSTESLMRHDATENIKLDHDISTRGGSTENIELDHDISTRDGSLSALNIIDNDNQSNENSQNKIQNSIKLKTERDNTLFSENNMDTNALNIKRIKFSQKTKRESLTFQLRRIQKELWLVENRLKLLVDQNMNHTHEELYALSLSKAAKETEEQLNALLATDIEFERQENVKEDYCYEIGDSASVLVGSPKQPKQTNKICGDESLNSIPEAPLMPSHILETIASGWSTIVSEDGTHGASLDKAFDEIDDYFSKENNLSTVPTKHKYNQPHSRSSRSGGMSQLDKLRVRLYNKGRTTQQIWLSMNPDEDDHVSYPGFVHGLRMNGIRMDELEMKNIWSYFHTCNLGSDLGASGGIDKVTWPHFQSLVSLDALHTASKQAVAMGKTTQKNYVPSSEEMRPCTAESFVLSAESFHKSKSTNSRSVSRRSRSVSRRSRSVSRRSQSPSTKSQSPSRKSQSPSRKSPSSKSPLRKSRSPHKGKKKGGILNVKWKRELYSAVSAGQAGHVHEILTRDKSRNLKSDLRSPLDEQGRSALHIAALCGSVSVAKVLFGIGVSSISIDKNGSQPLHCAAKRGQLEICKILVKHGARIESRDNYGKTPMLLAAAGGHINTAKWIASIAKQQDLHDGSRFANFLWTGDNREATALHAAAEGGHLLFIEWLLDVCELAHAQPLAWLQSCTANGMSAQNIAEYYGYVKCATWIGDQIQLKKSHLRESVQKMKQHQHEATGNIVQFTHDIETQRIKNTKVKSQVEPIKIQHDELSIGSVTALRSHFPPNASKLKDNREMERVRRRDAHNKKIKAQARQRNTKMFGSLVFNLPCPSEQRKLKAAARRRSKSTSRSPKKNDDSLPLI